EKGGAAVGGRSHGRNPQEETYRRGANPEMPAARQWSAGAQKAAVITLHADADACKKINKIKERPIGLPIERPNFGPRRDAKDKCKRQVSHGRDCDKNEAIPGGRIGGARGKTAEHFDRTR